MRAVLLKVCLLLAPLAALHAADTAKPNQPNIIVTLIDDMGVHDGDVFGSKYFKTPQLSRLARDGMNLTQGYAACAVCSPTRAALLTGKDQPFFLYLPHYAVHGPLEAKKELLEKSKQVPAAGGQKNAIIYHAMISSMDQSVGRILDALGRLKLSDISETRDLAASKPEIRADLAARLDTWPKETGAQIPQKN